MKFLKKGIITSLFLFVSVSFVCANTVGNWTNVSYDMGILFPQEDTDNAIQGFSFTSGFSLESLGTTCTFNSCMPVTGPIYLNAGELYLEQDLIFRNTCQIINAGSIYGGPHFVELAESMHELRFSPVLGGKIVLSQVTLADTDKVDVPVNSVDWSYDGKYVVSGSDSRPGGAQVYIWGFDGNSLTQRGKNHTETSQDIVSVRWNPKSYHIAMGGIKGGNAAGELSVGLFDPAQSPNSDIQQIWKEESDFKGGVTALAWHPDGFWLGVGSRWNDQEISIYERDSEVLVASIDLASNQDVSFDAMDWNISGSYLAVGLDQHNSGDELRIYHFQGTTLTETLANDIDEDVSALDWHPTDSWIAIGLSSGSERLRIYHVNEIAWSLDNKTSAYVGEDATVYGVHWCDGGRKLVVGVEANDDAELRVYSFNTTTTTLTLLTEIELDIDVHAVRWSPGCGHIAVGNGGDFNYFLSIYSFPSDTSILTLGGPIKLFLNSDVTLKSPFLCLGDCFIDTRGNKFIVNGNGAFLIAENGSLTFQHGRLRLEKQGAFSFSAPTSKLRFEDTVLELASDVVIGNGSLEIDGDLEIQGPYKFTYATKWTSTIAAFSKLKLTDDATLHLGKVPNSSFQPIVFTDNTSSLVFDNASMIVTHSGFQMTKGNIDVSGKCTFSIDNLKLNEAFTLGDGTADTNVTLTIRGGSELEVVYGPLVMNSYTPDRLLFLGDQAQLSLDAQSTLYAKKSLAFTNGSLYLESGATLTKDPGVYLTTNQTRVHDYYQDFHLTGTLASVNAIVLDQNDELILHNGRLSKSITVSRDNNVIYGDGAISGNILFNDANSSLTWNVDAKVDEYSMVLSDGVLTLERDIDFYQNLQGFAVGGDVTLSGTIALDNHVMNISANDSTWTGSFYCSGNGSRMAVHAKVSLSGTWTIDGIQTIDGNGNTLELLPTGQLFVAAGSSLTFRNMVIKNLSGTKLSCLSDSATVVFDNVLIVQDDDYEFATGSIIFRNAVDLIGGAGCSDETTYSFSYNSDQTSSIDENSTFHIMRGIRFESGDTLSFADLTSVLHLDESTLRVVDSGMNLLGGRMRISNSSILDVDTTYGVTLGDGVIAGNDFFVEIEGDAKLTIESGILFYNNIASQDRITFIDRPATLRIAYENGLTSIRNLVLKDGTLRFPTINYLETLGSSVIDQDLMRHVHDVPFSMHTVKGSFQTGLGYLLVDDGFMIVTAGVSTMPLVFDSGRSTLAGIGIVQSSLTLRDRDTTLAVGLDSELNSDIVLNGGTLDLSTKLVFVGDKTITGSGTITLNKNKFYFGSDELTLTHSLFWNMSSATYLGGKTSLSGTWTFDGTGSLNGDGNILDMTSGGRIVINNDSTLYLSDIVIKGIGDDHGKFIFMNDNAKVYMSNVSIVLASDFSTTIGSVYVEGPTTWYMDNHDWTFDLQASLTVDGMTLWKDSLDKAVAGNILFGSPEASYLSLLNSGTIKETANGDWIMSETTILGNRSDAIPIDTALLFSYLSTIDHGPFELYFDSPPTMSYNIYLGPQHRMFLQSDMTFNGSTWYIHFSRANEPLLFIDPGKTVTLRDVVLKDFHPSYVSFGDEDSTLVFGGGTTVEIIEDFTLSEQWTFTGNCTIKGFNTKITLGAGGIIDVYDGSTLTLEDITISGLSSITNNLRCRTNDSSIVCKDSELALSDDYAFTVGSISFVHDVKLSGTKAFVYSSLMSSTIANESSLYIDHGTTFSYAPPIANRNLLVMTDTTSRLHLNGAVLYSTPTGLRLTEGMVLLDNYVTISAQGIVQAEAIFFDDLIVVPLGGSYVETYGYIDM